MIKLYLKLNKIILLFFVAIMSLLLLTTSCNFYDNVKFPEISEQSDIIPTPIINNDENDLIPSGEINIALPISQETMNYLINLYVGKVSGIFPGNNNQNGLNISIDTLIGYDVGLYANKVDVPSLGFSSEEIIQMNNSGTLPDIYMTKDTHIFDKLKDEISLPLEGEYLNNYLIPKNVYTQLFTQDLSNSNIYSLPYYGRVKMLYINKSLFDSDVIDPLLYNYPITFNSVSTIASAISNQESDVFAWRDLFDLSAFLPGSLSSFPENFLFSKKTISFDNESFISAVEMLKTLSANSKNVETLTEEDFDNLFENNDPILNNKVFFWIDYSDKFNSYKDTNINNVSRYPLPVVDKMNIPVSTINIAVNPNGNFTEICKNLSIFMAYDNDALLLKSRFEKQNGFIPIVTDNHVWEELVLKQEAGRDLFLLKDYIDNSYLIHPAQEEVISFAYKILYDKYIHSMIYENISIQETVKVMEEEALELFEDE